MLLLSDGSVTRHLELLTGVETTVVSERIPPTLHHTPPLAHVCSHSSTEPSKPPQGYTNT